MKKWYPYRFKTREEFGNEYRSDWRNGDQQTIINFISDMDYLFGQIYPFDINLRDFNENSELPSLPYSIRGGNNYWRIRKFMLIQNKPIEPNYKPKKIERSL